MTARSRTPLVLAILLVVAGLVAVIAVVVTRGDGDDDSASTVPPPATGGSATPGTATGGTIDPLGASVTVEGTPLPEGEGEDDPAVGMAAPTLQGTDYTGTDVEIAPGAGGPMMIVFLAHWCPHCNDEIPVLLEWRDSGGIPADLQIFGVSTQVEAEAPNYPPDEWLEEKGWDWPVLADSVEFTAGTAYGVTGFPYFTIVDADGNVAARGSGEIPIEDLQALVDSVV